jgi:UDPglucose--hexose-1-phosphate uridylyltransferase
MGELRRDYLLDKWVIIARKRGKRPHQVKEKEEVQMGKCFFCPGNEHLTGKEIGRIGDKKGWKLRWFPNKFPAVTPEGEGEIKTNNQFFMYASNYGHHEVIVETNSDTKQLATLSAKEIKLVLGVWKNRIVELEKKPHIKYVNVFKNHGAKAGTSIAHSHSQVIALNIIPSFIKAHIRARKKFIECPDCKIIAIEMKGARRCFENEHFVAFTPYASQRNYELKIFSKKHQTRMEELDLDALAEILQKALSKLHPPGWAYNLIVHYSPKGEDLHFHIAVLPRIAKWAGFELETEVIINGVPPEDAAAYYRGEV